MPYIKQKQREKFKPEIDYLHIPDNSGELNYLISEICLQYLEKFGEKYQTYNDIIGVLECCKQELYRKKIAKYEDEKEKENGTIW